MQTEQKGTRVVGATSTSRPAPNRKPVTRVCFKASRMRSNVDARMGVVAPGTVNKPQGTPTFRAHLLGPLRDLRQYHVTVGKHASREHFTHPHEL
jgi:hypothetical protein